jgi:hypothetical protein
MAASRASTEVQRAAARLRDGVTDTEGSSAHTNPHTDSVRLREAARRDHAHQR